MQTVNELDEIIPAESTSKPFIEANTIESSLWDIKEHHIIPVFVKDNETVISHSQFIEASMEAAIDFFKGELILSPSVRLSHPIKGRTPDAKNKRVTELVEAEKTLYYERMAFVIEIPSISQDIGGNELSLTIGGVKAYNLDNLYNKKGADEHFKFFVGFQNKVCTNLCIQSDGYAGDIKVKSLKQLKSAIFQTLQVYSWQQHLETMKNLTKHSLTEHQFAQLIGRCRMYNHLPPVIKGELPALSLGDSQINAVVKDYYKDESFCRDERGNINLWKLYNLFTGANKSSYIDNFLDRATQSFVFAEQIKDAMEHQSFNWYLN